MPRLALELPDELGRVESRENRTEGPSTRTRGATVTEPRVDDPKVSRWHRCWAGADQ
ncbi:MAG: hypothetical protein ABEJ94_06400 [Halorientalis sp.]